MKHSNTKPLPLQFDFLDDTPTIKPELAVDRAELPDLSQIRGVIINGKKHYSLIDILTHHGSKGSAKNPTVYWKRAKERLESQGADVLTLVLEHRFKGQGQKNTPVVSEEGFMRIAQSMDIVEWEVIRAWMAQEAAQRLEEIRKPELAVDRAEETFIQSKMSREGMTLAEAHRSYALYLESKEKRNDWTSAMKDACIEELQRWHYAKATNIEYENLFGMTAKEISDATGHKTAKNALSDIGRHTLMVAEMAITEIFRSRGRMRFDQAAAVVATVCQQYGLSIKSIESQLGVSLATGKSLLSGKN